MPKTILLADDDAALAALLRKRFEAKGYRVYVAPDGLQVVMMARDLKPDLIISDLQMPGAPGGTAASRLKNVPETAAIPVIFLSGMPKEEASRMVSMFHKTRLFSKKEPLEDLDKAVEELTGGPL